MRACRWLLERGREVWLAWALVLSVEAALAADANGDFALEGAGLAKCERFSKSLSEDSTEVLVFGGWMHGYLSGVNQYRPDTYDIATWPSQKQQLKYLGNFCAQHPDRRFFEAVAAMVIQMTPERLVVKESAIQIDDSLRLYPSTIARIRDRLVEAGFLKNGSATGAAWGDTLQTAISEYQRQQGLEDTGLPDEATLLRLLR